MRNPDRRYMVNAPTFAMEKIMIDALPASVFVGTREMKEEMEERKCAKIEEFVVQKGDKIRAEVEKNDEKACFDKNRYLMQLRKELETRENEKDILQQKINAYFKEDGCLEVNGEKFIVSPAKIESRVQEQIKEEFLWFKNPYALPLSKNWETRSADFLTFMEKHPPMLSGGLGKRIDTHFTLFDSDFPEKPWLTINRQNGDYQWMFTDAFSPAGQTHYIVVDLHALAKCRPVFEGIPEREKI